jgi:hypothetical protein
MSVLTLMREIIKRWLLSRPNAPPERPRAQNFLIFGVVLVEDDVDGSPTLADTLAITLLESDTYATRGAPRNGFGACSKTNTNTTQKH